MLGRCRSQENIALSLSPYHGSVGTIGRTRNVAASRATRRRKEMTRWRKAGAVSLFASCPVFWLSGLWHGGVEWPNAWRYGNGSGAVSLAAVLPPYLAPAVKLSTAAPILYTGPRLSRGHPCSGTGDRREEALVGNDGMGEAPVFTKLRDSECINRGFAPHTNFASKINSMLAVEVLFLFRCPAVEPT
ncbi:hypothetical protein VTI74DRAFT_1443 [Chaetomium olivicolor]